MPLKVDHIGVMIAVTAAEKMIKADLIKGRGGSVGRDMPADIGVNTIGFDHHRHRVPADVALDPPFDLPIAGIGRLFLRRNRVNVRRADRLRNLNARVSQALV